MSEFSAKMHQNRFRLGLRPRPRWGSSQRSPRPPSWIKGGLLLREGEGIWEVGKGREHRGGKGKGGHPPIFYCTPSSSFLEICLCASDVCLSRTSALSREQRGLARKTKIGTEVAHVTCDSDTTFRGGGILWRPPAELVLAR